MAEKVTVMVLKVDLQCPCCYKKIKKILCKFPQIRDRVYNDKANTVTITVVCCDPEKLRDKLCCKGSKVIKSIEIVETPKPKPPDNKPKEPQKPKEIEKPKVVQEPPKPEKPKDVVLEPTKPDKPKVTFKDPPKEPEKPKEKPPPPPPEKPKEVPKPDPPKAPAPAPTPPSPPPPVPEVPTCGGYPPVFPPRTCCGPCSEGYGGGPCYFGYGVPPPPQPCFEGYYGYGYHERPCHVTRCDYYFSEENPQSCSIM